MLPEGDAIQPGVTTLNFVVIASEQRPAVSHSLLHKFNSDMRDGFRNVCQMVLDAFRGAS
ncbi:hypothetical protein [Paenibacillus nasutitermitis]|uniref:Uncharacterized protein n=1 Tax=Paenibacillus nasutitermitis TaxID=1652958 RepID=A0A917DXH0_9BACL|nr:hypothetical protein [Paenibacillus nasutitermitis]GGD78136.1 hypothetical protein GCM10010911_40190 [Paenibacillus nasutitermitis]